MNRSKSSLLAWTLFAIVTATALFSIVGDLANRPAGDNLFNVIEELLWDLLGVEFAFLAVLIVSRQPRNIIGRLMMVLAAPGGPGFFNQSLSGAIPNPTGRAGNSATLGGLF